MWRLDKFESLDSLTGSWIDAASFAGWTGYILYDGQGHMGAHLTQKGYDKFNTDMNIDSLNLDDLKKLTNFYKANFVYFANYNKTDKSIEHKRLSATEPKNWGTSVTRDFDFKGDTLILTPHESINGQKLRLRWIRL